MGSCNTGNVLFFPIAINSVGYRVRLLLMSLWVHCRQSKVISLDNCLLILFPSDTIPSFIKKWMVLFWKKIGSYDHIYSIECVYFGKYRRGADRLLSCLKILHCVAHDLSTRLFRMYKFVAVITFTYTEPQLLSFACGLLDSQGELYGLIYHSDDHFIHYILFRSSYFFRVLYVLYNMLLRWSPLASTEAYWFLSLCCLRLYFSKPRSILSRFSYEVCGKGLIDRQGQLRKKSCKNGGQGFPEKVSSEIISITNKW